MGEPLPIEASPTVLCGVSHLTLLVALPLGIFPVYPPGEYTGKIPIAGKYTIYFPGGAFDLRGYYDTNVFTVDTFYDNVYLRTFCHLGGKLDCYLHIIVLSLFGGPLVVLLA